MNTIRDYLQTQALALNPDSIAIARAATQAVIAHGQAHIERSILQPEHLPENIRQPENEALLKQLYMALDSAHSRHPAHTATRWPDEQGAQDFRNGAVRFFDSVDEMLADERAIFDTFQMNLADAVREAVNSEEANASVLEAINRALQSDPSVAVASSTAGTTSAPSAAPSTQPDDAPTAAGAMPEF